MSQNINKNIEKINQYNFERDKSFNNWLKVATISLSVIPHVRQRELALIKDAFDAGWAMHRKTTL